MQKRIHTETDMHNLTIIQSRAEMDYNLIDEYAAQMQRGVEFDPIKAIYDNEESRYYVYDGAHRIEAMRKAQPTGGLRVNFENGTRADAEWAALAANAKHGLRRSRKTKRRVTKNALLLRPDLSNRELAKHCQVDHKTVGRLRVEMIESGEIPQIDERTVERNGTTYTQKPKSGFVEQIEAAAAATPPQYTPIHALESLVRAWLGGLMNPNADTDILSKIRERSQRGQDWLSSLSDYVRHRHDAKHRKSDLRQACNNVLEQMRQEATTEPIAKPCASCGNEYHIQATNEDSDNGLCWPCTVETRAEEREANSIIPKLNTTETRRFELKQRIRTLLRSVPDEKLDQFDDWLTSVEIIFDNLPIKET